MGSQYQRLTQCPDVSSIIQDGDNILFVLKDPDQLVSFNIRTQDMIIIATDCITYIVAGFHVIGLKETTVPTEVVVYNPLSQKGENFSFAIEKDLPITLSYNVVDGIKTLVGLSVASTSHTSKGTYKHSPTTIQWLDSENSVERLETHYKVTLKGTINLVSLDLNFVTLYVHAWFYQNNCGLFTLYTNSDRVITVDGEFVEYFRFNEHIVFLTTEVLLSVSLKDLTCSWRKVCGRISNSKFHMLEMYINADELHVYSPELNYITTFTLDCENTVNYTTLKSAVAAVFEDDDGYYIEIADFDEKL